MSLYCHYSTNVTYLNYQHYLCPMKEQDLKDLLARPELNATGIANKMYEGKSNPRGRLHSKVNNLKSGNGYARLTEDDLSKAWEVLKDLADDIYSKAPDGGK